jgi:hypothetical protein|tara:strand:+ start:240 stop:605 length:366 start_codon:yes stop_codon:yes gene_type:complete
MAHFAKIDSQDKVIDIYVVNNDVITDGDGNEQEQLGINFLTNLLGPESGWFKQTSYNATFRKNYATIGSNYDRERNAFISDQPYASWTLNESTCRWEAPTARPTDGKVYTWNEATTSWVEL